MDSRNTQFHLKHAIHKIRAKFSRKNARPPTHTGNRLSTPFRRLALPGCAPYVRRSGGPRPAQEIGLRFTAPVRHAGAASIELVKSGLVHQVSQSRRVDGAIV